MDVVVNDSGETAFKAAQGFGLGVTTVLAAAVVGLSETIEADLGDGDAMQGGIELAVARTGHAYPPGGVS